MGADHITKDLMMQEILAVSSPPQARDLLQEEAGNRLQIIASS
jgi:hypothetical protein